MTWTIYIYWICLILYRHRTNSYEEDEGEWGCGSWFEYALVVTLASVLLIGSLALTLFWVLYYREGFAWSEKPILQFNLHPVLMVAGFITFSGFCEWTPKQISQLKSFICMSFNDILCLCVMLSFSNFIVPHLPMLPTIVCQVIPYDIPCSCRSLRSRWFLGSFGLPQPCNSTDSKLLFIAQLAGIHHHGSVCYTGEFLN